VNLGQVSGDIVVTGWTKGEIKIYATIETGYLEASLSSSRVSITAKSRRNRMGKSAENINAAQHSANTRFFEVTGQLRQGQVYQLQKSLLQRDGTDIQTLWREQRGLRSEPGCLSTIPLPC
jgi:hypothetical protein